MKDSREQLKGVGFPFEGDETFHNCADGWTTL